VPRRGRTIPRMREPFVRGVSAPRWRGGSYKEKEKDNPSWEEVEDAVRALNADDLNDLYLEGPDKARMVVGGGSGQYIVSVDVPDDQVGVKHFSVLNPQGTDEETIDLVVGGQLADWPTKWVVDLDTALSVARSYYRDGTLDSSAEWERV
jgi:hypothetical protein